MAKLMDPICGAPGGQRAHVFCRATSKVSFIHIACNQILFQLLIVKPCFEQRLKATAEMLHSGINAEPSEEHGNLEDTELLATLWSKVKTSHSDTFSGATRSCGMQSGWQDVHQLPDCERNLVLTGRPMTQPVSQTLRVQQLFS